MISLPFKVENNPPMRFSSINLDPGAGDYYIYVFGLGRKKDFEINDQLHYIPLDHSERVAKSSLYSGDIPLGSGWCTGDSGGPVSVIFSPPEEPKKIYHYLIGVAFSFINLINERNTKAMAEIWGGAENVPRCGNKIYYTRVTPYIPWIEEQIKVLFNDNEKRELNIFVE